VVDLSETGNEPSPSLGISSLAERVSAYQEGLWFMEFVT